VKCARRHDTLAAGLEVLRTGTQSQLHNVKPGCMRPWVSLRERLRPPGGREAMGFSEGSHALGGRLSPPLAFGEAAIARVSL
jgi:hypothetical protein